MQAKMYKDYMKKINVHYEELVNETKAELKVSKSKGEDLYILNKFWNNLSKLAIEDWQVDEYLNLFGDNSAMCPMPESVSKQLVSMMFDIKHLNILFDLGINEGLDDDIDNCYDKNKSKFVKVFNEYLEGC